MGNKKYLLLLLLVAVCLCSCGSDKTGDVPADPEEDVINDIPLQESMEEESNSIEVDTGQQKEFSPGRERIPINTTQETIPVEWNNERIAHFFTTIGNKMYFCQWAREGREAALYEMQIGGASFNKVNIEIPEGMDIYGMTTDSNDNLYLLMSTLLTEPENLTSMIRTFDSEGHVVGEVDISEAIAGNSSSGFHSIIVDFDGNFYIKGWWNVIHISKEGDRLWCLNDKSMGIDASYDMLIGEDGEIYMSYLKNDLNCIARVNPADGILVEEYILPDMSEFGMVLAMGQAANGDFLLYGSESGTWIWDKEENKLEKRTAFAESKIPYSEVIRIQAFLEDGRLFLAKNISDGNELVGVTCQYLPTVK